MKRNSLLTRALCGIGLSLLALGAHAQADDDSKYPQRAIRFIVPLAPGGVGDVMTRMVAEHLQAKWGQPVVVDNRPGAGTIMASGLELYKGVIKQAGIKAE